MKRSSPLFERFRAALTPVLATVGGLVVLAVVVGLAWRLVTGGPGVPDGAVLELDLERSYPEHVPNDLVARSAQGGKTTVLDVVSALERAAEDDRVKALVARLGANGMGTARIQEIRDAVLAFRASGKPAVAWAETFGEFGPGNGGYYLATAFDRIWLQPSGDVGLTGLFSEAVFPSGALDNIGVTMRGDRRHEYKNAYDALVDTAYSEAFREATVALMRSTFDQMVEGISRSRRLDSAATATRFDRGPHLGEEAVEAGLVDGLAYRDQVYDRLEEELGGPFQPLYLPRYLEAAGGPYDDGVTVALIHGVGPVTRGESEFNPAFWTASMGSATVTAAFRAALRDDDVEAILFRVDSPGGSYVASDAIWRMVEKAREAGKPVVVSMGDVAGSGGYFVSMAADRIVAHPATITGSIGVLHAKPLTSEMWRKIGIDWDDVQTSDHAEMWSGRHDYDPDEWDRLQAWLDRVYEDFTAKVARGRGLPMDSMPGVARGRIWSGEDARELGLVDELGGYPVALDAVRRAAGMEPDAAIELRRYPRPVGWWDRIFGDPPASSREEAVADIVGELTPVARPASRLARRLGLVGPVGVLTMPDVRMLPDR